ncbi:type VI secretion system baseplate subunit TssE [Massilia sp. W12]|uniref:type VI secretion system baseplate subunit TssE n=1 Tax=Massilia sp. W12 TaxID=3126507 RepID=UPI0030CB3CFF
MAELAPRERLQPSLLDRLTDLEPEKSVESRDRRVLSIRTLREGVLRDLAWLLNTTRLFTRMDEHMNKAYPYVANSVLNYGMPDISGMTLVGMDLTQLEKNIEQAILDFEPRLIPDTVKVRAVSTAHGGVNYNKIMFEIEGDMWAQPYPERLYLKTELDMEGAAFKLTEVGGPS